MAPARRTALFSAALVIAGLTGIGYANASQPEPAYADTIASQVSPEAATAAAAQAAADAADRDAIRELVARADARDAEIAAAKARAEAEAAAAAQAAAEAAHRREQLSLQAQSDPKGAARGMLGDYGWGDEQFTCLDKLWTRESQWSHTADNPTSSAYGIPQALPGKKMASAGADWETNPATQIKWGLGYIDDVYGAPCKAWGHSESHNWY